MSSKTSEVWGPDGPDYYAKRVILAETMTKACFRALHEFLHHKR